MAFFLFFVFKLDRTFCDKSKVLHEKRFEAFIHYFSKAYHCAKLEYFGKRVGARYPLKVNWSNTCLASSPAEF